VADGPLRVLFLCTGNSARSILAESLLKERGRGRFVACSAGSHPKGEVHPLALELLGENRLPTAGLRSKSWDEFAAVGAPAIDVVITVCGNAAGETCPVWPGQPITAHWGVDDPAAVDGSLEERRAAFRRAFKELDKRITAFTGLAPGALAMESLKERLEAIGRLRDHG
jgi:arsenate reductase